MEQAADAAGLIAVGAKGESEEGFLEIIVTVEEHPLILKIGGNAPARVYKGFPDGGPGRSPALSEVLTHGMRMLATTDRPVAIVVDLHVPGAPHQRDRESWRRGTG